MSQPGPPWGDPGQQPWTPTGQQWSGPPQAQQPGVPPGYGAVPPGPYAAPTGAYGAAPTGAYGAYGQPASPWGPQRPGNSPFEALLTGDWLGALLAAGLAVVAMLAVSLVGMLVISEGDLGFRELLALVLGGACLAVGGDAFAEASGDFSSDYDDSGSSFGGNVSAGILPLTVTAVGLLVLGFLFARRLRSRNVTAGRDVAFAIVRTALVFALLFLPLSLLTHYTPDGLDGDELGLGISVGARLGVGVPSSMFGALLFAGAATGLVWLLRGTAPVLGRFRPRVFPALRGATVVFAFGLVGSFVALVVALSESNGDEVAALLGVFLLAFLNLALAAPLWSAGVPLASQGELGGDVTSSGAAGGSSSVDLLTFTDYSGWFWLAPVLLLVVVLAVAVVLVLRQQTLAAARVEGLRFAGMLALVAFAAALLLRIGYEFSASGYGYDSDLGGGFGGGTASLAFNPFLAAAVVFLWGAVLGQVAPVLAAKMSPGFVSAVRSRFGTAPMPEPRRQAPVPEHPAGYGYATPPEYGYAAPPQTDWEAQPPQQDPPPHSGPPHFPPPSPPHHQ